MREVVCGAFFPFFLPLYTCLLTGSTLGSGIDDVSWEGEGGEALEQGSNVQICPSVWGKGGREGMSRFLLMTTQTFRVD